MKRNATEEFAEILERVTQTSDDFVEKEIRGLERSPFVKLAMAEGQIRQQRLAYRDHLRTLEHRGKALVKQGWTFDMMEGWDDAADET